MNNLSCIHIDINKYPFSETFKSIMKYMSGNCLSMSNGIKPSDDNGPVYVTKNTGPLFDWFPNKPNIKKFLILVFPTEIRDGYLRDTEHAKQEFTSGASLIHTIGHCYITWDYTIGIIGIWDMCIHKKYLDTPGYGSVALTSIIDSLNMEFPNYAAVRGASTLRDDNMIVKIWLCVDMANNKFSNVVHLYAKHGFSTPIVDSRDPFGNDWSNAFPNGLLCLSRNNEFMTHKDFNKEIIMNDIIYAIQESVSNLSLAQTNNITSIIGDNLSEKSDIYCNMSVKFDIETINILKKFSNGNSTMNDDGSVTQKEISGAFFIKDNTVHTRFQYTMPNDINPGSYFREYVGTPQMRIAMDAIDEMNTIHYNNAKILEDQLSVSNIDKVTKSKAQKIMTTIHNNYMELSNELGYVYFILPDGQVPGGQYLHVSAIPDTLQTVSPKTIVWDLNVDIDTLSYGTENEVSVPDNKYSFHTHPRAVYNAPYPVPMDKIIIGPKAPPRIIKVGHPSGRDYYATLVKMLMHGVTFHTVVSPTGVYIISLNPDWFQSSDKLKKMLFDYSGNSKQISKKELNVWRDHIIKSEETVRDEITKSDSKMIRQTLLDYNSIKNLIDQAILAVKPLWVNMIVNMYERYWGWIWEELSIDDSCRRYANICTQSRPLGSDKLPLISVDYKSWDDLEKGQLIHVQYKTIGKNCMTYEEDARTYRRFFPISK
jgi:hypothetical protein